MKSSVHIHHNRLVWIYKGQRISLSLSEAKALSQELMDVIPELQSQVDREIQNSEHLYAIDTVLRSQADHPEWLNRVHLDIGVYAPIESVINWRTFWDSVRTVEPEVLMVLLDGGAFDRLLRLDPSLVTVQAETLLSDRLRKMSEPMEWVGPCSFEMGDDSLEAWDFERPVHTVQLTEGFWIGRSPVTQQLYWEIMNVLPDMSDDLKGALKPVIQVSWWDVLLFCNRLSVVTDRVPVYWVGTDLLTKENIPSDPQQVEYNLDANGYRLPTEAEWECAAKGFQPFQFSGAEEADNVAWTVENSRGLSPVGMKESNALGLYDMSGLVWEWCWDGYDPHFYAQSPPSNPIATTDTDERVCRGGSYTGDSINARVSLRGRANSGAKWNTLGFRIVCRD